jgi:hypothetical protein
MIKGFSGGADGVAGAFTDAASRRTVLFSGSGAAASIAR